LISVRRPLSSTLLPYTTLFRSDGVLDHYEGRSPDKGDQKQNGIGDPPVGDAVQTFSSSSSPFNIFLHLTTIARNVGWDSPSREGDRKSTRLNSSHVKSSYAVFC